MSAERFRFVVTGRVQGVAFRYATQGEARALGLFGWVRNRTDGSVEGEFEGEPEACRKLSEWLRRGPPMARVDDLRIESLEPVLDKTLFSVHSTS